MEVEIAAGDLLPKLCGSAAIRAGYPACRVSDPVQVPSADREHEAMVDEKIKVRSETGQELEVVVSSKKADAIWVVLGEGVHSVKCKLSPTRNGLAYAGSVMGREIIFDRSVKQVQAELDKARQVEQMHFRR
jgi:hypothetical protein